MYGQNSGLGDAYAQMINEPVSIVNVTKAKIHQRE